MRYVYHHIGMGDHLLCNAIVRREASKHEDVLIAIYHHNYKSVEFMYRDLPNVHFHLVRNDDEAQSIIKNHDSLVLGFPGEGFRREIFDQSFYKQAGMEFAERWNGFKVCRDASTEDRSPKPFRFIHDDPGRNFWLTQCPENKTSQDVRPRAGNHIFQNLWFLENAEEIHCFNSSFLILADSVPTTGKLFFHWYARKTDHPRLKKDWKILE